MKTRPPGSVVIRENVAYGFFRVSEQLHDLKSSLIVSPAYEKSEDNKVDHRYEAEKDRKAASLDSLFRIRAPAANHADKITRY